MTFYPSIGQSERLSRKSAVQISMKPGYWAIFPKSHIKQPNIGQGPHSPQNNVTGSQNLLLKPHMTPGGSFTRVSASPTTACRPASLRPSWGLAHQAQGGVCRRSSKMAQFQYSILLFPYSFTSDLFCKVMLTNLTNPELACSR